MADHLLEEAGYETHFSGQMSPLVKIERIFEKFRPHRLYISVTYIENIESTQQEIDKLFAVAASYNTAVFVGGRGFELLTLPGPAQRIEHFSQLIAP
jgi:hypothetical protein